MFALGERIDANNVITFRKIYIETFLIISESVLGSLVVVSSSSDSSIVSEKLFSIEMNDASILSDILSDGSWHLFEAVDGLAFVSMQFSNPRYFKD